MPNRDGRSVGNASIDRGSNGPPCGPRRAGGTSMRGSRRTLSADVPESATGSKSLWTTPDPSSNTRTSGRALRILKYVVKFGCPSHPGISSMPEEKPSPEPEGPPVPAKPERAERGGKKKEEPKAPRGPKKLEGVKEDFRYIVRMANTDLDGTRSVSYSLTAIPGVGIRVSEAVADLAGVPRAERLGNLSEEQTDKIEATFANLGEAFPHWMVNRPKDWETGVDLHLTGADVEIRRRDDINRMKMIRSYKGVRHETGQKVRGQRTRSNGRTGLTVGVTKKAALAAAQAKKAEEAAPNNEEKKEEKKDPAKV